ncbi:MAG: hypothetical protein D6714_12670 [Bacteroidetes bacterium]|nr:MAG: hypothetical protein D6714_12670 [Bacteroidota bacterium]
MKKQYRISLSGAASMAAFIRPCLAFLSLEMKTLRPAPLFSNETKRKNRPKKYALEAGAGGQRRGNFFPQKPPKPTALKQESACFG